MGKKEPLVSIIVITYGHENYIKQALDSILMQEVNFDYEILVGEDCSPDNTREVLKEYEKTHPNKFVMVYRDKNIGGRNNLLDLYTRARGEYIAQLEGDDFWVSNYKLQKQIDFLEVNDNFIATSHNVEIVDEFGNIIKNKQYPECKRPIYSLKKYKYGILPGQAASLVMRNFIKKNIFDLKILSMLPGSMPSDRVIMFMLASNGDIYCYQESLSAYRYVPNSGTSFSARQQKDKIVNTKNQIDYYDQIMKYSHDLIENKEAIKAIESIFYWHLFSAYIKNTGIISFARLKSVWKSIRYKSDVIVYIVSKIISLPIRRLDRKKGIIGR